MENSGARTFMKARNFAAKGCRLRVDPAVAIEAQLDVISEALQRTKFNLDNDDLSLKSARRAIVQLLQRIVVVHRQDFWDSVRYPDEMPWNRVPQRSAKERGKMLKEALEVSHYSDWEQADAVKAMDTLVIVTRSLSVEFAHARLGDDCEGDVPAEIRYMCSSILMNMRRLLKKKWLPLKERLAPGGVDSPLWRGPKVDVR